MKKLISLFSLSLCFIFITMSSNAQNTDGSTVVVSGSTGANGNFGSLTQAGGAFAVINAAGSQAGNNIVITVFADVATEDGANSLNAGDWTTLTISPGGGFARTISGSVTGHLINLDGADNVTIDGLNTGGNSLTFSNAGTGAASTIRLINDASNNTITNCTILGSASVAANGVVFFSTGTTTGNDGNNINNCNIGPAGANLPLNGVFSLGTNASVDNSGNTINANSISDYFSATLVSIGINLAATGNSAWTITNNGLFQTATRVYTAAQTHNGIFAGTGSGYTITGNIIGYATSTATGVYTMTSTVATRFIAINLAVGTTTATSVQGNTVTAISLTTSSGAATTNGILCGINITAGNVNVGNVTPNTIGASSGTGALVATPTTTQGAIVGINSSSTGTILIQNNIIGSFSSSGTTAAIAGGVFGINVSGITTSMTITGNTIGNSTANNMRSGTLGLTTGSSLASGINASTTPVSLSITSNTIQNFTSYGTGTGGYVRGINGSTAINTTSSYTISLNTINNLTTNSALTGYTSGNTSAFGIQFSGGLNGTCSQNTISNISNINAVATTNIVVSGINLASGLNSSAFRNRISGLSNAGIGTTATAPPVVAGIIVRSGTTSVNVYNNMISIGDGQTTNTCFLGIMLNHGSTPDPLDKIYYNSVNISGTVAAGALLTSCLNRGDLSATSRNQTVDIRNNILSNTRTGGTGNHYAISNNPNATSSATGWVANASNFNVLNAAAGTIGHWTTPQTFAGWKTASSSDASSFSAITVTFVDITTGDLHLNMGVTPTVLESSGTPIAGITTDHDNDTRPGPAGSVNGGAFAPDFGADEFDGVYLDLAGPTISYSLLTNAGTSNRSFTNVTITDFSGVDSTAGTRPRCYYKRTTDGNVWNDNTSGTDGWKYAEANGPISQFDFTIDYSLLNGGGGVILGNLVQYFVVAQDLMGTPNVGINSGTFAVAPASVALTAAAFPIGGTINSYIIVDAPLSGSYTVGVSSFNRISGHNLEQRAFTRKVKTLVPVISDSPVFDNRQKSEVTDMEIQDNTISSNAKDIQYKEVEVEETYYELYENGNKYTGFLYAEDGPRAVYATITAAVNDLNLRGVNGPVTYLLIDANYPTETYPIQFNSNIVGISSTNTVTLRPQTATTSIIPGSIASNAPIRVLSSYVTIDGSNSGGTDRSLTIQNNSVTAPSVVLFGSTGTTPITNVTIKNCIVTNGAQTASAIVTSDAGVIGNPGYFNTVTIQNNLVERAFIGVYCNGGITPQQGFNLLITENTETSIGANSIRLVGLYCQGVDGVTFSNNTISNIANTADASNITGIWGGASGTINATVSNNNISNMSGTAGAPRGIFISPAVTGANVNVTGNAISGLTSSSTATTTGISVSGATEGVTIQKNTISNIKNTNATGFGCNGIQLSSTITTGNVTTVKNNMIFDIAARGFLLGGVADNGYGIILTSGGGYSIYYNSVSLATNQTSDGFPAAFNVTSGVTTAGSVNVRDNIFSNTQTFGTNRYSIYSGAAASVYTDINYNDYHYGTAPNLGFLASNRVDLTAWQTATLNDANSISGDPLYLSSSNLHIDSAANSPLGNAGTSIAGITDDYDGDTRNATTPDIGADEFNPAQIIGKLDLTICLEACRPMDDTIAVSLRSTISPYALIDSARGVLDTSGNISLNFNNVFNGPAYYIVVYHRNSIETWSATGQSFATGFMTYDFTTDTSKAFGGNMTFVSGEACIYTGDVDQDGVVDGTDAAMIDNDAFNFELGYLATDLNCDGAVDGTDAAYADNNAFNLVIVEKPTVVDKNKTVKVERATKKK